MTSSRIVLFTALVVSALAHGRAARAQAPVKIAITARGDVGQYAGMCGSRAGKDSLSGDLRLVNYDSDDRTALYEGTLQRNTAVDACGTQPNPSPDQVKWCFAHLDGSAQMKVTLEVYEDGRGAWVKSEPVPAPGLKLTKKINGCPEAGDWLSAYPKDELMSGLSFENVPSGYLRAGTYGTKKLELVVQ
jgi:hypothetical protein